MFIELMLCIFVEMVVIFHFKITHIVCIKSLPRIIEKLRFLASSPYAASASSYKKDI